MRPRLAVSSAAVTRPDLPEVMLTGGDDFLLSVRIVQQVQICLSVSECFPFRCRFGFGLIFHGGGLPQRSSVERPQSPILGSMRSSLLIAVSRRAASGD